MVEIPRFKIAHTMGSPFRRLSLLACLIPLFASMLACASNTSTPHKATPTSTPSYQSAHFASSELGIAFDYAPEVNGDTIATKQTGNLVYIYDSTQPYTEGQFVEVLPKPAQDNLQQAISNIILKGYDAAKCPIGPAYGGSMFYPASFSTASITYATMPDPNGGWPIADPASCPAKYTIAPEGGIAYFLIDAQHPDKLLFISVGLSGINASTDPTSHKVWQDTIAFM